MSEIKAALREIESQLKILNVTVAAIEDRAKSGLSEYEYIELRKSKETANQFVFDRLAGLIDAIPDV